MRKLQIYRKQMSAKEVAAHWHTAWPPYTSRYQLQLEMCITEYLPNFELAPTVFE